MSTTSPCLAAVVATVMTTLTPGLASQRLGTREGSRATLPDWSGAWIIPFQNFGQENVRLRIPDDPSAPRLTPPYAALMDETRRGLAARDPGRLGGAGEAVAGATGPRRRLNSEDCLPTGMPNVMRYAFAIEFLFTPGRVTILLENDDSSVRRIYTDGRAHSDDPDPSYNGESIGHWEGQTLVVHTIGISPRAELVAGVPTSGRTTVTERIHLVDKNHLQIDSVIEDPLALREPWRATRVYVRTEPVFFERICLDNNREGRGDVPNLTPPKP